MGNRLCWLITESKQELDSVSKWPSASEIWRNVVKYRSPGSDLRCHSAVLRDLWEKKRLRSYELGTQEQKSLSLWQELKNKIEQRSISRTFTVILSYHPPHYCRRWRQQYNDPTHIRFFLCLPTYYTVFLFELGPRVLHSTSRHSGSPTAYSPRWRATWQTGAWMAWSPS